MPNLRVIKLFMQSARNVISLQSVCLVVALAVSACTGSVDDRTAVSSSSTKLKKILAQNRPYDILVGMPLNTPSKWVRATAKGAYGTNFKLNTVTGKYFTAEEFKEWYGQSGDWLEPGQSATDPNNYGAPCFVGLLL